jgi:hypothetical protein
MTVRVDCHAGRRQVAMRGGVSFLLTLQTLQRRYDRALATTQLQV